MVSYFALLTHIRQGLLQNDIPFPVVLWLFVGFFWLKGWLVGWLVLFEFGGEGGLRFCYCCWLVVGVS